MVHIAIGADHAGYLLKNAVRDHLAAQGHEVEDLGASTGDSVDYPDYAEQVGQIVSSGQADRGILVCGTGLGMSMAANKMAGIRAALVYDVDCARLAREHNDANVLCLGARVTPADQAMALVDAFLTTPFAGGRHQRRVDKINALRDTATA